MKYKIRRIILLVPLVGSFLRRTYRFFGGRKAILLEQSDQYWEDRYRAGGTSGSGSYGRLAEFKADFLNNFVKTKNIYSVVELGCGDGAQLALANYPHYIGFDVSKTSIEICRKRFSDAQNYEFHLLDSSRFNNLAPVDLAISLDVIFHLVEDQIFDNYMRNLFSLTKSYVVIYADNRERSCSSPHERSRMFTTWIEKNAADWELTEVVRNRYPKNLSDPENTSQSDFFVFKYRGKN